MCVFTSGCASPRPPRPPSLNLPEVTKDLTAQRTGDEVLLHWTTPEKNTDRLNAKGPIVAEVCRISYRSGPASRPALPPPACTPIARVPVSPGPSQASDALPQALISGPATLLGYRVQLLNGHGRSAGFSPVTFSAAGAAPGPVEALRAEAVPDGVELQWQGQRALAAVELDRRLIAPAGKEQSGRAGAAAPAVRPSGTGAKIPGEPLPAKGAARRNSSGTSAPGSEVTLVTPAKGIDPGGTIDSTAVRGATYRYTAQRVLTVVLDGHSLTLRSVLSGPVSVVVRDIFPPAVPAGLEAVPGGALTTNNATGVSKDLSIDLSWTPDTDSDLAGYLVYRQEVSSAGSLAGSAIRLTAAPVIGPAYQDKTAVAGQRYAYHVTAVDTSGNESAASASVEEMIRER